MRKPLYEAIGEAGSGDKDITEGYGTRVDLDEFTDFMSEYNVTADPESDRFLLQDDQKQYEVRIASINPDKNEAIAMAEHTGSAEGDIDDVYVLEQEQEEVDLREGAISDNGSGGLAGAAERAPDRAQETTGEREDYDGDILEPETESGWNYADNIENSRNL